MNSRRVRLANYMLVSNSKALRLLGAEILRRDRPDEESWSPVSCAGRVRAMKLIVAIASGYYARREKKDYLIPISRRCEEIYELATPGDSYKTADANSPNDLNNQLKFGIIRLLYKISELGANSRAFSASARSLNRRKVGVVLGRVISRINKEFSEEPSKSEPVKTQLKYLFKREIKSKLASGANKDDILDLLVTFVCPADRTSLSGARFSRYVELSGSEYADELRAKSWHKSRLLMGPFEQEFVWKRYADLAGVEDKCALLYTVGVWLQANSVRGKKHVAKPELVKFAKHLHVDQWQRFPEIESDELRARIVWLLSVCMLTLGAPNPVRMLELLQSDSSHLVQMEALKYLMIAPDQQDQLEKAHSSIGAAKLNEMLHKIYV